MMQRRKHRAVRLLCTGTISDMRPSSGPARGPPAAGSASAPSEPATNSAAPASNSRNPLIADLQMLGIAADTIPLARKPTSVTVISRPDAAFAQRRQACGGRARGGSRQARPRAAAGARPGVRGRATCGLPPSYAGCSPRRPAPRWAAQAIPIVQGTIDGLRYSCLVRALSPECAWGSATRPIRDTRAGRAGCSGLRRRPPSSGTCGPTY